MVPLLISLLILAVIVIVVLVVLLMRAAASRRTVAPGFERPPAQQRVVPEVRRPASAGAQPSPMPAVIAPATSLTGGAPVVAVSAPVPSVASVAARPRPQPLTAPPSLVGASASVAREPSATAAVTLAGDVELGFEGERSRIGIRSGSALQRAFASYADELLADLRDAGSA